MNEKKYEIIKARKEYTQMIFEELRKTKDSTLLGIGVGIIGIGAGFVVKVLCDK